VIIGGIQATALLSDKLGLSGGVWSVAANLSEQFNSLGFFIVGLFAACWLLSWIIYRWKGFDRIEVAPATQGMTS
jgi:high-affinity nickel-transport protein